MDVQIIAGIDEAGRGPLAGPVVAAACILRCEVFRRRKSFKAWSPFRRIPKNDCILADSKALEEEQRENSYKWIVANCAYGIGMASAKDIDTMGILRATEQAMREAVTMLERTMTPDLLLVDGKDAFSFPHPHRSIIRGDGKEPCIAAASIIAKVTRDRLMKAEAAKFPHFGFDQHKGYGTPQHQKALREHGMCELHRRSFVKVVA